MLVPTRELALQTAAIAKDLAKHLDGIRIMTTTGGTNLRDDILRLKDPGTTDPVSDLDVIKKYISIVCHLFSARSDRHSRTSTRSPQEETRHHNQLQNRCTRRGISVDY